MRNTSCVLMAAIAAAVAGCGGGGGGEPLAGLAESVDHARAANTLNTLQTGLVTLSVVQVESGTENVDDLVASLQAKDPAHRYTTEPPTDTGIVQVLGGNGGPVMLVAISQAATDAGPAQYVAAWQGTGTTMYYAGTAAPPYSVEPPTGNGWGATLPQ